MCCTLVEVRGTAPVSRDTETGGGGRGGEAPLGGPGAPPPPPPAGAGPRPPLPPLPPFPPPPTQANGTGLQASSVANSYPDFSAAEKLFPSANVHIFMLLVTQFN
jgi:hypothetical protein